MLRIRNITLSPDQDKPERLRTAAAAKLGLPVKELQALRIVRRSIDARRKDRVQLIYTVDAAVADETAVLAACASRAEAAAEPHFALSKPKRQPANRPVVAGFGPAGMFAALSLAEAGLRPIVLERGDPVELRQEKVRRFRETGHLDPSSNVQFGEGGAGTFSDGKLNTGVGGSAVDYILGRFAAFGAPQRIRYEAAPHVGTDILRNVVRALRQEVLRLGGEIRFGSTLCGLECRHGALHALSLRSGNGIEQLPCDALFLAVGHSARDTLQWLLELGIPMEPKPFAMGVRIEHLQHEIDRSQYGRFAGHPSLGAAPYKLALHLPDGTGVYTFCMCPGGYVMAAASEEGGVVTNGMSYSGRAGRNANSALLVSLKPEQFPYSGVLGGMYWQRELEQTAFRYGGGSYAAPAQRVGDLLLGQATGRSGTVQPTYLPGVRFGDLRAVLPSVITGPIATALPLLERKLRGFSSPDALLTGPETRSSSPVRMLRGESLQAPGFLGLYPCGEGAGWAGGIVSAAADGLRCVEAYFNTLN